MSTSTPEPNPEGYDSGIIETAEEVEIPEPAFAGPELQPRVAAQSDLPPPSAMTQPPPSAATPRLSHVATALGRFRTLARHYPWLGMVLAPVAVAALLIAASRATPPAKKPQALPHTATPPAAPMSAHTTPLASSPPAAQTATVTASLGTREVASLSASELLTLHDERTEHEREDARAFTQKLAEQPELIRDPVMQTELLHLALDPNTSSAALAAMVAAPAPLGADLLYAVWTSRNAAPSIAELARSLLYSHEVRPSASVALSVALDLQSAATCEAAKASVMAAQKSGDRRALPALVKLAQRRGCGSQQRGDCYPCLRSAPQQLFVAIKRAGRRAPGAVY